MKVMTTREVRENFASVLDAVVDDADECIIPRGNGQAVVIVSLDEWNSMKETLHLLGNRANARHLFDAMDELDAGRGEVHEIEEPEPARRPAPVQRRRMTKAAPVTATRTKHAESA